MKDDYQQRGIKRSLSFGKRFAVGWLLPVVLLMGFAALFNHNHPRLSSTEGGFNLLGQAVVTLSVLGAVVILDLIIVLFPSRNVTALIAVTLTPAFIGAVVIVLAQ